MLASQFEALESPRDAIFADTSQSPDEIVKKIRAELGLLA
mgnify:CR=1 FL=1